MCYISNFSMLHLLVKGLVCQFSKLLIFSSLFEHCRPLSVHVWNVVDFLLGIWVLELCILLKIMTTLTYWNCFNCYFVKYFKWYGCKKQFFVFFFFLELSSPQIIKAGKLKTKKSNKVYLTINNFWLFWKELLRLLCIFLFCHWCLILIY